MKIEISDLIFEVKENIRCYEELGDKTADKWEKEFMSWIEKAKEKKIKSVSFEKDGIFFKIKDEEEVMEIADEYCDAVFSGSVKAYWEKFK